VCKVKGKQMCMIQQLGLEQKCNETHDLQPPCT